MVKLICICFLSLFLMACAKPKPEIIYQDVYYRVISCPTPGAHSRPDIMINKLSDNEKPGIVANYYNASIMQLQQHIDLLEQELNRYDEISKIYSASQEEYNTDQKSLKELQEMINR